MCGEKRQGNMNKEVKVGSPPRMRGKVWDSFKYFMGEGITPAYAGKSKLADFDEDSGKGSPPRMRGKELVGKPEHNQVRITPAYAGKRI